MDRPLMVQIRNTPNDRSAPRLDLATAASLAGADFPSKMWVFPGTWTCGQCRTEVRQRVLFWIDAKFRCGDCIRRRENHSRLAWVWVW